MSDNAPDALRAARLANNALREALDTLYDELVDLRRDTPRDEVAALRALRHGPLREAALANEVLHEALDALSE